MSDKKQEGSLKNIEDLLERLLDEILIEAPDDSTLPIPTHTFLEMERIIGERINLIGLS